MLQWADEGHVATTCWGKGEHCNRQAEGSVATVGGRGEGRVYCNSLLGDGSVATSGGQGTLQLLLVIAMGGDIVLQYLPVNTLL